MLTLPQYHADKLSALRARYPDEPASEFSYFTRQYVRADWINYLIGCAGTGEAIKPHIWNGLETVEQHKIRRSPEVLRLSRTA